MHRTHLCILLALTSLPAALVFAPAQEEAPKDGKEIGSKTLPDLKLVRIGAKGKTFTMGSPAKEEGRSDNETEHEVKFSADYYLGVTTVTRGQFAAFVKDEDYQTEAEKGDGGYGWDDATRNWVKDKKYTWRNTAFAQTDTHPVVNVSWHDAVAFCKWLSKKDKQEYRLPTEAQWEYACRAGSRTRFSFGDDEEDLAKHGNVADAKFREVTKKTYGIKNSDGYAFTAPVGQYQKNAYGLMDMHGNVWQWCSDVYGDYPTEAVTDPHGPVGQESSLRVIRGGSWDFRPQRCRSAFRNRLDPVKRDYNLGFRIAVSVQ